MILNLVSDQSWGNIKQNEPRVNLKVWDETMRRNIFTQNGCTWESRSQKTPKPPKLHFISGNSHSQNISSIYSEF